MNALLRGPARRAWWVLFLSALLALCAPAVALAQGDPFGLGSGRHGAQTVSAANTVLNSYAALTLPAAAGANVVTVSNGALFAPGDLVLLWQAEAGVFASGGAGPVDLTMGNAGRFELQRVASVAGNVLTLAANLAGSYVPSAAQAVLVREYTSLTVTAAGSVTAPAWNGSTGGIVALFVNGALQLDGALDASGRGDRGGAVSLDFCNGTCTSGMDLAANDDPTCRMGGHGEGIDTSATAFGAMACGTGNRANGGGGGGYINAGGAGGGNGGAGGHGGDAWSSHGATGGLGGAALAGPVSTFFTMGGGGGGGQQNNTASTPGAAGGGVLWVRALSVAGAGSLRARGGSVTNNGNDGQGGGGAGGTVFLQVVDALACSAVDVSGGHGGDAAGASVGHGTGGGGGGGRVRVDSRSRGASCANNLAGGTPGAGWTGALAGAAGVADTGSAYGCRDNTDCSGTSPLCSSAHLCVPCTATGAPACPSPLVCATSGANTGACVPCVRDADCAGGRVCNAMNQCVVPACLGNAGAGTTADCALATPVCSMPGTATASCGACPAATVYDTAMRRCVPPAVALTTPPAGGTSSTTNVRQPLSGTGVAGQSVTVSVNGTTVCTATVDAMGRWSCTPGSDLALGAQAVTALSGGAMSAGTLVVQCTTDAQCTLGQACNTASGACVTPSCRGNAGAGTSADCTLAMPVCNMPGTAAASCGTCALGTVFDTAARACATAAVALTNPPAGGMSSTTMRRPAITGTGVPGQMVVVLSGGMAVCTATVDAMGRWSCTPAADLPLGPNMLSATSGGATSAGTLVVQCTMDSQCAMGQACDTAMGACVTPNCLGNAGAGTAADCALSAPSCSMPGTAMASCGACAMGTVFNTTTHACVTPAVALTSPPAGGMSSTTNRRAPVTGTGVPGQQVTVSLGGSTVCTAVVAADGTWQCVPGVDLPLGANVFTALSGGATSMGTLVVQCTMDSQCATGQLCAAAMGVCVTPNCLGNAGAGTAADCTPALPQCTGAGTAMADCGPCAMGQLFDTAMHRCVAAAVALTSPPAGGTGTTTMTMPTVRGTGVPGQSVTVSSGGATLCVAMVQADGTWSCTATTPLPVGSNPVTATSGGATSMGTLVVQCTASGQCSGATPVCDTASGSCVQCVEDTTCGAGRFCDMAPHRCVDTLPVGSPCGRPAMCRSGLCAAGLCAAPDAGVDGGATDASSADGAREAGIDGGAVGRLAGAGTCGCAAPGSGERSPARAGALLGVLLALVAARRLR